MPHVEAAKDKNISSDGLGSAATRAAAVRRMIAALVILGGIGTVAAHGQSLVQNRITAPIRSDQMQAVHGTVPPILAMAQDQGALGGSTMISGMSLIFRRSAAQEADLKNLLQEQQTKGSPMYHQWLGPGQFAARYGVSQQDLAKVSAWLQSRGFAVTGIPASADRIMFSGTAARVNAAFQTQMHRYTFRGQSQWANATEVSVPQAIAGMTLRVAHLSTFRPLPHSVKRPVYAVQHSASAPLNPHYTLCASNASPCPANDIVNFVAPSDIQTIYDLTGLYNASITGTGQTMAIVGQTDILQYDSDIKNFRTLSGLNASNLPTQILVQNPNTGPATPSAGDLEEADIDVEWSGAVAKDATILYVTVGSNQNYSVFDALQYAIQNPLVNNDTQFVPVISISYGGCEINDISQSYIQVLEGSLEQANAQGQTIVAASGDSGSAACDVSGQNASGTYVGATHGLAVDYPSSSQYVTAVGGTSFSGDLSDEAKYWNQSNNADNGSAISYIPETTWNDTPTLAALAPPNGTLTLSAGGGGASMLFAKPSWQVGPGVPSDGKRDVPDMALAADPNHDGYVLCTDETTNSGALTGTSSCAYPVTGNEVPYFDTSGSGYVYGGTSIAAPQIAAMITLWNQEAGNTTGVGNANPIFYLTAQNTASAIHDVTTGSNAVVCEQGSPNCVSNGAGGYVMSCCNAGAGYDEATGLGSVDATAMGAVWPKVSVTTTTPQPTFSLLLNPSAISVNPGSSVMTSVVLNPSGAGTNSAGFSGTVNLTCSNLPSGVTCSFSPNSSVSLTSGKQQTVSLTISATSSAAATSTSNRSTPKPLRGGWPVQTALAGILGLSLLGLGRKRRFFPSRWMAVLLLLGGLLAATALTACGGGGTGSNSNSSTGTTGTGSSSTTQSVTVTGTSGGTTASASIQLTVT
ncbi:MAG: S53 family peptidase [Acidobacteriaceae bacterium]